MKTLALPGTLIFASLLASSADAIVWRNDITETQVRQFGQDPRFVGVGKVNTPDGSFGTGTFLGFGNGAAWILTAAHVISTGENAQFFLPGQGTWSLTQTYAFPGSDISISRLTNFTLDIAAPQLSLSAPVAGEIAVSAGFGGSAPESQIGRSRYVYDDNRRGMQTRIVGLEQQGDGPFIVDRFDSPTDPNVMPLEGFGAPGDSGSMLLTGSGVIGVLTRGGDEDYGQTNDYSYITPTIRDGIYARTGITPVPEPATIAALGLGAMALLRRRRKGQA